MLIPLLLLTSPAGLAVAGATAPADPPPIRISFNDDGKYIYGDQAKVYLRSAADGYVVVLRSDARGNVRVLSPVDPDDNQQINGGKKYETKGRGGRETFLAEDTPGQGLVLAAWSGTPFDIARYERNARWDIQALGGGGGLSTSPDDAESRLLSVVDAMKPNGHYEYDAATYTVYSPQVARAVFGHPYVYGAYGWGPGWWGYSPWWGAPYFGPRVVFAPGRFGLGFGRRWY